MLNVIFNIFKNYRNIKKIKLSKVITIILKQHLSGIKLNDKLNYIFSYFKQIESNRITRASKQQKQCSVA